MHSVQTLEITTRKRISGQSGLWLGMYLCSGMIACSQSKEFGWKELAVQTRGPKVGSAMSWDPGRKIFFLHGGHDGNWNIRPETWAWSPGSPEWNLVVDEEALSPGSRISHTMVRDSRRARLVLFGGTDMETTFGDVWALDGSETKWTQLETLGLSPPPRSQHGMVYDPATDQVLVFGGRDGKQNFLRDTWLLDMADLRWTKLDSPEGSLLPQPQDHVKMAHDTLSGVTVLSGGSPGDDSKSETWHFDFHALAWSLVDTPSNPPNLDHGFLCPVEKLGGLVLFGFYPGPGDRPGIWLYRPNSESWSLLKTGASAPDAPLDHGQVASDGEHLFLLGGFNPGTYPEDPDGPGVFPRGSMWSY